MENPLNPTSVPLEAETIFWFEFLLNPALLTKHLVKQNTAPSPIELISTFLSMAPDNNSGIAITTTISTPDIEVAGDRKDDLKIGRKQMALKILGLKVASHLKWNLQSIERHLIIRRQVQLLSDLCSITSGKLVSLPISSTIDSQIGTLASKQAINFALTIYHRWVLRTHMNKGVPAKPTKQSFNHILQANQDQVNSFRDEVFLASLEPHIENSLTFLNKIIQSVEPFVQLTYDSFVALDSNMAVGEHEQNFNSATVISTAELRAQIAFELCDFYLYDKKYDLATQKAAECRKSYQIMRAEYAENLEQNYLFCTFTEDELNGCLMACGLFDIANTNLIYRMNDAIANNYNNIQQIFAKDNEKMDIPLVNRRITSLDMDADFDKQQKKQDKINRADALNVLRSYIDCDDLFVSIDFPSKSHAVSLLLEEVVSYTKTLNDIGSMKALKQLCYDVLLTPDGTENNEYNCTPIKSSNILTQEELDVMINQLHSLRSIGLSESEPVSSMFTTIDWKLSDEKITLLELGAIKRQIINCATPNAVRVLLVKCTNLIMSSVPPLTMEPWHINSNWKLPAQIDNALSALPRGFLQDYAYISVAKARDFIAKNEFKASMSLLNAARTEVQRHDATSQTLRLSKVIENEILFTHTTQQLHEWPQRISDIDTVLSKCKQVFKGNGDIVAPRLEILCTCAAVLLNYSETAELARIDRRYPCELYTAIASIVEAEKHKSLSAKKIYRDAWDAFTQSISGICLGNVKTRHSIIHHSDIDDKNEMVDLNRRRNDGNNDLTRMDSAMVLDEQTSTTNDNNSKNTENNGYTGSNGSIQRDNPNHRNIDSFGLLGSVNTNLLPFIQRLRDPMTITIVLSMFVRLHNILDDNSNREINIEYLNNWPASIPNSNSFNVATIIEILNITLRHALQYYPQHVSFIRLEADIEFRNENYEAALAFYVNAIMSGSQYCTTNLDHFIDDYIVRRMMKCSTNLGCYMQAAILCQFLTDIDYGLAFKTFTDRSPFKSIADKSIVYTDAMDSYYSCIWDVTLLEFMINFLTKRGEHTRKQLAVAALGQLELNTNNNDEIRREAATCRKVRFLRALSKQYSL